MSGDLADLAVLDLLRLQARAIAELRRRGVLRTNNNPAGDYAEHLCARAFGWTLAPNSQCDHDATSATGRRFQIKARRLTGTTGERELGAVRGIAGEGFDDLVVVLFAEDWSVARAAILTGEELLAAAVRRAKGWVVFADDRMFARPGVVDVTDRLRAAAV